MNITEAEAAKLFHAATDGRVVPLRFGPSGCALEDGEPAEWARQLVTQWRLEQVAAPEETR